MSRFIDPSSTVPVDLGDCQCPGKPHSKDVVQVRKEYSGRDKETMGSVANRAIESDSDNAGTADAIAPYVVSWNLLRADGQPMPCNRGSIALLDDETLSAIIVGVANAVAKSESLPNRSGGPSAESPLGTASPTP